MVEQYLFKSSLTKLTKGSCDLAAVLPASWNLCRPASAQDNNGKHFAYYKALTYDMSIKAWEKNIKIV
jgi:hypothetical protein